MAFGVEVGGVIRALEVLLAEGCIHWEYATGACCVENRKVMTGTYLTNGLDHLHKAWSLHSPRRDKAYGSQRIFLAQPGTE